MSPSGSQDQSPPSTAASKSPLERLLDVGVYAPLGLLANKGDVVEDLAAKGRKQVAFSRSLGRAALRAVAAGDRSGAASPAAAKRAKAAKAPAKDETGEIDNYSTLTAREVIALIPTCSPAQREWIASTERAGKGRVTVLRALEDD